MAGFNFNFNLLPPNVPASLTNTLGKGVPVPVGYAWLTDFEGNPLYDFEGNRLYGAIG